MHLLKNANMVDLMSRTCCDTPRFAFSSVFFFVGYFFSKRNDSIH